MLESGMIISGKYRIMEKIGQGGMSRVFLAEVLETGARAAVKEMRSDRAGLPDEKDGLMPEIDLLGKLHHPGLPRILDVLSLNGSYVLVMEHISGKSLQAIINEFGAQPLESVIDWGKQLCGILAYMHKQDPPVIYRDLKPANIILEPNGMIRLIDFGAAREFKQGEEEDTVLLGTRGYAAPEQYGGYGQSDPRTDIYGLGATLYYLVTGHDPSKSPYLKYQATHWNPDLPQKLDKLIQKCVRNDPNQRYSFCGEVENELEALQLRLRRKTDQGFTEVISKQKSGYIIETDITIVYTNETLP